MTLPDDRVIYAMIVILGFVVTWSLLPRRTTSAPDKPSRGPTTLTRWRLKGEGTVPSASGGGGLGGDDGFVREVMTRRMHEARDAVPDWTSTLGLELPVDMAGLRRAYVSRMREVHPDSTGTLGSDQSQRSAEINEAYAKGRAWLAGVASGSV